MISIISKLLYKGYCFLNIFSLLLFCAYDLYMGYIWGAFSLMTNEFMMQI